MHLWDKGGKQARESIIDFTCGRDRELDNRLALYDITGSMAHAVMLGKCGIISVDEADAISSGLTSLFDEARKGELKVDVNYEDIHSLVEDRLRGIIGETAGKLHTGRSRNDQVLTDIHLWARHEVSSLASVIRDLAGIFLDLSEQHKSTLMPGMTHMQAAMVSSFGLWFASYAESLCDDLQMLANATTFVNASPLGTAAGYGTSLPVNREMTASLLQFERLIITSPYAQMSRGRMERAVTQAIASVANTLGRFSSDVILFMSPGFGFIKLDDEYTTGSSIMPQKKNPDVFELTRARCNRLQAVPNEVTMMTACLPAGYNRDYQELKNVLFNVFDEIGELAGMIKNTLPGIRVNSAIFNDGKYNDIFSVDEANRMALGGIPFRDAYRAVAGKIGSGLFEVADPANYNHTGSIGNTGNGLIRERADKVMKGLGFPSPEELFQSILGRKGE